MFKETGFTTSVTFWGIVFATEGEIKHGFLNIPLDHFQIESTFSHILWHQRWLARRKFARGLLLFQDFDHFTFAILRRIELYALCTKFNNI